jgi:hypothetical protein
LSGGKNRTCRLEKPTVFPGFAARAQHMLRAFRNGGAGS